jgi:hypothetical protein
LKENHFTWKIYFYKKLNFLLFNIFL